MSSQGVSHGVGVAAPANRATETRGGEQKPILMAGSGLAAIEPAWREFIRNNPNATTFHHPNWIGLLADCYGYESMLAVALDQSGQVVGGIPLMKVQSWLTGRRLVALPFSDFVPLLAANDSVLTELTWQLDERRRNDGWPRLEVHWELPAQEGVYHEEPVARHVSHLAVDPLEVFRRFHKTKVQQPIRQAERGGVIVRMGESWADLWLFYGLHLQTRRRLGTPVQPLRFFRLLWDRLLSQGLGFVLLAYKESQLLAGAVFLHWNGVLTYKYSASDPAYWGLRPNNLLLWHAMRWGCGQGYRLFDWGRTDLHNQGLLEFKRAWGTEEKLVRYSVLADQPPSTRLAGRTQGLLSSVITRSPSWVCRTIGELLYGHSA